ncbi:sulfurtransferase [Salarchaeum japonicum]|uniref:Sulfurtransferase n=1 Tax=Salarchaeum japonicum TaxID=555573 RepID=A0AAV3T070_9EURY|nr:sulfurtransferase [Salarchaeum japonicum]
MSETDDLVVSASWVAERLDDPGVRVVDVRDAWEYDGIGHVPSAVNVPFDAFRTADGESGMMPPREDWTGLLSDAGVESDTHLVAYDDTHGVFAARFLVTALYHGHPIERLHLLDGDFSSWTRDHEASAEAVSVEPTTYDPEPPETTPFVGADAVAAASEGDAVVVDTREPGEYDEGHIPGAVNLDWKALVDEGTRGIKHPDELEVALGEKGIVPGERVVLYCNTARRISHTFVVLRWLGFADVQFYEGSLTEWRELGRDVAT